MSSCIELRPTNAKETSVSDETKPLIEVTPIDREFYATRLRDWLPRRLIDVHTHVWRDVDRGAPAQDPRAARSVTWPSRVAKECPIEDLIETYRIMLPGKQVTPLIFPTLPETRGLEPMNRYASECSRTRGVPALIFSDPSWDAAELERRVAEGGFLGIKSYLSLAPAHLAKNEITIFDYFPPRHLEVVNRRGWILMLHLPRDGRLRDPVNLEQLVEIDRKYPAMHTIIAHVGRAYCDVDVGEAFDILKKTRNLVFDFSANTNANVFTQLLRAMGPGRTLFGTDMPILRMRTRRIVEGDCYVNLVPKGLYGDVSGDKNMREVSGAEAESITFFLYEELAAFRQAAEAVSLSRRDLEAVFHDNAARILAKAGWRGAAA
jgi:predicted TIM-barrel fold metal-dependent hydrolase